MTMLTGNGVIWYSYPITKGPMNIDVMTGPGMPTRYKMMSQVLDVDTDHILTGPHFVLDEVLLAHNVARRSSLLHLQVADDRRFWDPFIMSFLPL